MRAVAILLWVLLPLVAQQQAPSKASPDNAATASVAGLVVRAETGEPLKRAEVTLWSSERETSHEAITDAEGRFQIMGVKPGRYRLWASREGYVTAGYGEKSSRRRTPPIILEAGQQLRDVVFRLQRTAVIIGRVVNEDGEPVPDAEVSISVREPGGKQRIMEHQSAKTNDLGDYRIFRVDPGKYYLGAKPPNRHVDAWSAMNTSQEAGEEKSQRKNQPPTYASVFYPGTNDFEQATRLVVKAADELRIDFTFTPVQAYKVSGRVFGPLKTKEPLVVMLMARQRHGSEEQAARVRSDGTYEIYPVVPGSYRLVVSTGADFYSPVLQNRAKAKIEVTNSNLENVDLTLLPVSRAEVKGRLMVEGEASAKLEQFVLILFSSEGEDDDSSSGGSATVKADGSFSFDTVSPGTYSIEVNSLYGGRREYYIKSGRYGNRELVQSTFTVTEASSPRLEVVLSSAMARIEGVVVDDNDRPLPGASVVAVPSHRFKDLRYWYLDGVTDQNGRFVLPRLRPGEYRVVAFEDAEYRESLDPDLLEKTERASVRAHAQTDSAATLKLKVVPAPEAGQD